MRRMGINECLVKAVYNLFKERRLVSSLDGSSSVQRITWKGLPQGSPISPLGFNIVVHGLFTTQIPGVFHVDFADDITVAIRGPIHDDTFRNIQAAIDEMIQGIDNLALEVSPSKCSTIVFSKRFLNLEGLPELSVGGLTIPYQESMKLLGLHLTPRLSWRRHFMYVKHRASTYVNFMRSIAGQKWGSNPLAMLTIYKSCIRPILEYASIFFSGAPEADLVILDRIQWNCIRIALGSTKTTHTGSLEVMSGWMPLASRREMATMRFVERRYSIAAWHEKFVSTTLEGHSCTWVRRNILQYINYAGRMPTEEVLPCFRFSMDTRKQHVKIDQSVRGALANNPGEPADEVVEAIIQQKYPNAIRFATDGSKGTNVGYAVVDPQARVVCSVKLPDQATVFLAELMALRSATELIAELDVNEYVVITDSLSNLTSLSNTKYQSRQQSAWFEVKQLVARIESKGSSITFLWVPSHMNVPLNEAADDAAKEACVTGEEETYIFTSLDISFPAQKRAFASWQHDWDNGNKGRFCHGIIPSVSSKPWFACFKFSRREIVILCKLVSNHSRLLAHLRRNNIVDDDICQCGESAATPDHLLFSCILHDYYRRRLWRRVIDNGMIPELEYILKEQDATVLKAVAKFFIDADIDLQWVHNYGTVHTIMEQTIDFS